MDQLKIQTTKIMSKPAEVSAELYNYIPLFRHVIIAKN